MFVELEHEIISTVILPLSQIQDGQLSVTGESRLTDRLDVTLTGP